MDRHRLAGDEIEHAVVEREVIGVAEAVAEPIAHARALGVAVGLVDPGRVAIDADDARFEGEVGEEEAAPVARAGVHVEREARRAELPAPGQEREVVGLV